MVSGVDPFTVTVAAVFGGFQTYTWSGTFRARLERDLERLPLPGKRINPKLVTYQDGAVVCTGWDYYDRGDDPDPQWWTRRFGTDQQKAALTQEQED
jgi:hypothetical protein